MTIVYDLLLVVLSGRININTNVCQLEATGIQGNITGHFSKKIYNLVLKICILEFSSGLHIANQSSICIEGANSLLLIVHDGNLVLQTDLELKPCVLPQRITKDFLLGGYHNLGKGNRGNVLYESL